MSDQSIHPVPDTHLAMKRDAKSGQSFGAQGAVLALVILIVTCVVYWPEVHYALVWDDVHQIGDNPRLTSWSYLPGYFTTHLWAHVPSNLLATFYYRPLFLVWFRLQYVLLGQPSPLWHLSSILAHIVATACVFLLCRKLADSLSGAALAAGIFALHPIQAETVAWLSASGDILLTTFVVLSVYFYAMRKGPISLLSLTFATMAMFTKEAGVVILALIFIYEWTQTRLKIAIVNVVPYVVPAILYVTLRTHALGNVMVVADPSMSIGTMVLTWPRLIAVYFRHLIWPVHLSLTYSIKLGQSWYPLVLLSLVLAGIAFPVRKGSASTRFGAIWFAITLSPALAIRFMSLDDYVHDRYLYLPSVGIAIMLAPLLGRIRFAIPQCVAACAIALALCWGTRANMSIWQDELALLTRAYETAPQNAWIRNGLAIDYMEAHRYAEAYPILKQLLDEYPNAYLSNQNMGEYYLQIGDSQKAGYYLAIADRLKAR